MKKVIRLTESDLVRLIGKAINENNKNWMGQEFTIEIPSHYFTDYAQLWSENGIDFELRKNDAFERNAVSVVFDNSNDSELAYKLAKEKELEDNRAERFGQDFKKTKYVPGHLTGFYSHIKKGHGLTGNRALGKFGSLFQVPGNYKKK